MEPTPRRRLALYALLGFSAGLPFYLFNATLLYRLSRHGVDIVTIGFFASVALLPTFKFAWAPLLDRFDVPGFARFWGKRRGWIMLAQLGIAASLAAMAFTASDRNLPLVALTATLLAFWTTTLEVAADAWRIELAPTAREQGPLVAANLWGYRSAMVVASGGAIWLSTLATVGALPIWSSPPSRSCRFRCSRRRRARRGRAGARRWRPGCSPPPRRSSPSRCCSPRSAPPGCAS